MELETEQLVHVFFVALRRNDQPSGLESESRSVSVSVSANVNKPQETGRKYRAALREVITSQSNLIEVWQYLNKEYQLYSFFALFFVDCNRLCNVCCEAFKGTLCDVCCEAFKGTLCDVCCEAFKGTLCDVCCEAFIGTL